MKAESDKDFLLDEKYGFLHSCPTNLGTGMRASVHVDLPGWTKEGLPALKVKFLEAKLLYNTVLSGLYSLSVALIKHVTLVFT